MPALRTYLSERGVPAARLSLSSYWREGLDEEGCQNEKRTLGQPIGSSLGSSLFRNPADRRHATSRS